MKVQCEELRGIPAFDDMGGIVRACVSLLNSDSIKEHYRLRLLFSAIKDENGTVHRIFVHNMLVGGGENFWSFIFLDIRSSAPLVWVWHSDLF